MPNNNKHIPTGREANFDLTYLRATVDFNLPANQVTTVIDTGVSIPAYTLVDDVYVVAREALDSAGDTATLSVGQDSDSDPGDFLDDEAEASFAVANNVVLGIPQAGDSSTRIKIGATARPLYVKVGTEAFTSGIADIFITLRPYR